MVIAQSSSIVVEDLAEQFNVTTRCIRDHLKRLGYVAKLQRWVPHQLSEFNKFTRKRVCKLLAEWQRREDFFPNMITCDEKWIYYDNQLRQITLCKKGEEPEAVSSFLILYLFINSIYFY